MNNKINNVEENKRKPKHKFNVVDVLILILVVTIIGTVIFTVVSWNSIKALWATSSEKIEYVVELRGVDADFINNIKKNDLVIDSISKNQLGTVQSADSIEPYTVLNYKTSEDGTYSGVLAKDDTKYNITVYVSATAEYEKGVGYTVNGTRIAVGETLSLRFPNFSATAQCIHISES